MADLVTEAGVQPAAFNNLVFKQELNEVYLLLDFVSGQPDRHLSGLDQKIADPNDPNRNLTVKEIVEQISKICYPPPQSSSQIAEDATLLLMVKDQLNTMVYPAKGLTIAYTTLFTEGNTRCATSRVQIAKDAFPSLIDNAKIFRRTKSAISWMGLFITVASALLLWQVTYGAQLAARFDEAKRAETDVATRLYAELDRVDSKKPHNLKEICRLPPSGTGDTPGEAPLSAIQQICNEYAYRQALFCVAIADIGSFTQTPTFAVFGILLPTFGVQSSAACLSEPQTPSPSAPPTGAGASDISTAKQSVAGADTARVRIGRQEDAQSVAGVLATMSNYILPILFGLVGTIAALVRGIQDKISDSVLAPRDLALVLIRLPLGMMAGVCVGLFLNPTSVAAQTNGTVGAFTISASGIAFLAGYGAEGFFGALDTLIRRIFSFEPEQKPRQRA